MPNERSTPRRHRWLRNLSTWAATLALHLTGVAVFFVGTWWILIPAETRQALYEAHRIGAIQTQSTELLLHAALSACFWAILVIGFKLLTTPRNPRTPRLVSARGTVIVETLIVFPVFLLMTLGLIQLTIINTAGLLTSFAAFNAARSISVWAPEIDNRKLNQKITDAYVRDKARVAAAMALAPVAPADFITSNCGSESTTLTKQLRGLRSVGHLPASDPSLMAFDGNSSLAVNRAFDLSNLQTRGHNKLKFAYCATKITSNFSQNTVAKKFDVSVEYQHQLAMPVVAVVFGSYTTVENRPGFYTTITRSHRTTAQIAPLDDTPGSSLFN